MASDHPKTKAAVAKPARTRLMVRSGLRPLSYERTAKLYVLIALLPLLVLLAYEVLRTEAWPEKLNYAALAVILWAALTVRFFISLIRPLQTLGNIVSAMREEDFSFRARGGRRGDALGDLALEINALASSLQKQRANASDAIALADIVMATVHVPVLAFDAGRRLRLANLAAQSAFGFNSRKCMGVDVAKLNLQTLFEMADGSIFSARPDEADNMVSRQWSVRRNVFRFHGVPHEIFFLTDVSTALAQEERMAWKRLIRVLGHEINNSLTPIKSIAGSLRGQGFKLNPDFHSAEDEDDFDHALSIIEDRAGSLNRFLHAYQELLRLPPPNLQLISIRALLKGAVQMERRVPICLRDCDDLQVMVDPDQLQQLIINVIKNAAEAAQEKSEDPQVAIGWSKTATYAYISVTDNGAGLTNPDNLFVPFYTTKPNGTGVGLALSKQIAIAHGGFITLSNRKESNGCIVKIALPLHVNELVANNIF